MTAGPSPGNREFPVSSDTATQRVWKLQGVYLHVRSWYLRACVRLSLHPWMHLVFFSCSIITASSSFIKQMCASQNTYHTYRQPETVCGTLENLLVAQQPLISDEDEPKQRSCWPCAEQTALALTHYLTVAFSLAGRSTEMCCRRQKTAYSDTFFSSRRSSQGNYSSQSER